LKREKAIEKNCDGVIKKSRIVQKNNKNNRYIRFGTFHFGLGLSTMVYDTLGIHKIRSKKKKEKIHFLRYITNGWTSTAHGSLGWLLLAGSPTILCLKTFIACKTICNIFNSFKSNNTNTNNTYNTSNSKFIVLGQQTCQDILV